MLSAYIYMDLNEEEREKLLKNSNKVNFAFTTPNQNHSEAPNKEFLDSEVAFGNVPASWVKENEKLKWLQLESVGFDEYQSLDERTKNRVIITSLKGMFGTPLSETVLGGLLYFYRGIGRLTQLQEYRQWNKIEIRKESKLLRNANILILGTGFLGQSIGDMLKGMGSNVQFYGRSREKADLTTDYELNQELKRVDILIAILPQTSLTENFLNRERIDHLRPDSIFVNVGRGNTVDEEALIIALEEERLAGAILDVTREEPLPENHPLWTTKNCLLLQHSAAGYEGEVLDKVERFIQNLHRYQKNQLLKSIVDFKKGY